MSNTTNTESFAQLFEESLAKQEMRQGEVITAEVLRVEHNFVVVNAGLKSEAYVPIEEFKDDLGEVTVQPGDFVSVAIESAENGFGETVLSRDKAKRLAAWMNLEQALESGELVTGTITGKVKGGLTVMTNGIRAFLPGSLVDTLSASMTSSGVSRFPFSSYTGLQCHDPMCISYTLSGPPLHSFLVLIHLASPKVYSSMSLIIEANAGLSSMPKPYGSQ